MRVTNKFHLLANEYARNKRARAIALQRSVPLPHRQGGVLGVSGVGTPADDLSTSVIRLQINMRETSVRALSRRKGVSTVPVAASAGWPMLLVRGGRGVNVSHANAWELHPRAELTELTELNNKRFLSAV